MICRRRISACALLASVLALTSLAASRSFAQPCVADYERTLSLLKQNAGECAKNNKLMTALTDAAAAPSHPGWTGIDTGSFRRDSAHDFRVILPSKPDYRWRRDGDTVAFNCTVPLSPNPMPQNEAFLECARVYFCASATASCGITTARQTGSRDCKGITERCMASHPIPQGTMGPVLAAPLPPRTPPTPPPAQAVPNTAASAGPAEPRPPVPNRDHSCVQDLVGVFQGTMWASPGATRVATWSFFQEDGKPAGRWRTSDFSGRLQFLAISAGSIKFRYFYDQRSDSGIGEFIFDPACNSFTGSWTHQMKGSWSGARVN